VRLVVHSTPTTSGPLIQVYTLNDFTVPLQCPDRRDRRLVLRPETGWPGHGTELSSLRYRSSGALDTHPPEEPLTVSDGGPGSRVATP
jgi:hypothetical protein